MAKEYYTIKEFAQIKGVSQQAIYKKLATTLQPYVVIVEGRKVLRAEALQPISIPTSKPFETTNSTNSVENDNSDIVKLLKEQIEKKDAQIERLQNNADEKDKYIQEQGKKLTELMEQANQLNQNNQVLLKLLSGASDDEIELKNVVETNVEETNNEPENKKGFFSKIFG